jgi:hypothetical protein
MNNTDLGRAHAWLLRYRIAETKSLRRNISKEEKEIANLIRQADPSMISVLEEILDGQGLSFRAFSEFDAPGIPSGGHVFVVARKPDSAPPFLGTERLIARMRQVPGINKDQEAKVWFVQLWFVLLDLIYTRKNRAPGSLQDYVETSFAKAVFIDAVREYINDDVRKIDPATLGTDSVWKILTTPKEGNVALLCNGFLELMEDAGLLERSGDDVYRQTLLFAFEMKTNYDRQLAYLLPTQAPIEGAQAVLLDRSGMTGIEQEG